MAETFESISTDIKNRKFAPVYFFCGEEEYFIDALVHSLETTVLNDMEKAFNQTVAYGKDLSARQIIETCGRLPMLAEKQVVIIKEAQALSIKQDEEEQFLRYLKNPVKSTVLVFAWKHGTPDGRKAFGREVKKTVYFESKPLYENQVGSWVRHWLNNRKFKIDERAVELLVESAGTDLSKVANELEKIIINKKNETAITIDDIENSVGISKEYNVFELQSALALKNRAKVFQIANYFVLNPKSEPLVKITATLQGYFTKVFLAHQFKTAQDKDLAAALKVNPYFVKDYKAAAKNYSEQKLEEVFFLLEKYDLRAKGVESTSNFTEGELLKEMVFRILN